MRNFKLGFAKRLISFGVSEECREALEKELPELAESEDERISKEIVTYLSNELHNVKQLTPRTNEFEAWITYLKKQKELTKDIIPGYPAHYVYDGEKMHFLGNPAMEEKQKEQKPVSGSSEKPNNHAGWSEEDEMMRKRAVCACNFTIERTMDESHYVAARDWLKSLGPQPHLH